MTTQALSKNPVKEPTPVATLGHEFVTMMLDDQLFGIPVLQIQDVLNPQYITPVPLAPKEIVGLLNLRGRVVTAIDMRLRLGMPTRSDNRSCMSVVAQHEGELYSLIVDRVGDVMTLSDAVHEKDPTTLPAAWRDISHGIYRLDDRLLIALDIGRLLRFDGQMRDKDRHLA